MQTQKTCLACLASLAALALSCSPADVVDPAIQKACKDYAYAYCAQLEACSAPALQIRYGTTATCESLQSATCQGTTTAPSSGATAASREACASALPSWTCSDFIFSQNPPPACQKQGGPLPNGAACAVSPQCQSAFCALPAGSACGTCAPLPEPGDSCASTQCAPGLACVGTPPICAAYAQVGASCQTSPCSAGATCVGGACAIAVKSLGAACSYNGAGCDLHSGLACNGLTNTCATAILVQPGHACGVVAGQQAYCVEGACVRGACVADVPAGGACEIGGTACVDDARCVVPAEGGTIGTCQINGTSTCP